MNHHHTMQETILLVDDDTAVLTSLGLLLKKEGYTVVKAQNPEQARQALGAQAIDLVIQDMNFGARQTSGEEGMALLREIKAEWPQVPVVLITAWGSISLAVAGMQAGASDFITKPWQHAQILQTVATHLGLKNAEAQTVLGRSELDARYRFGNIIGEDPQLLRVLEIVGRISLTDAPVLIMGESGTGKELIAEAVHNNSQRQQAPMVRVNLGSIPESLFESELFGHVKGAFTDARADRAGRFEAAEKGTIFLDEIGDLPYSCQVKLLRVLQDRTYQPVGSSKTATANVRVVSATNRNLAEMVHRGEFREDLLYRLNLIVVHLPPLRERRKDIPLLAQHFLERAAKLYRRPNIRLGTQALEWLQQEPFPGNIRELQHLIERTAIIATNDHLQPADLQASQHWESRASERPQSPALPLPGSITLDEMEKQMIIQTLEHFQGNLVKAAEALGISRFALYRRMEKFGIGGG